MEFCDKCKKYSLVVIGQKENIKQLACDLCDTIVYKDVSVNN
jgi:hypothetical protein